VNDDPKYCPNDKCIYRESPQEGFFRRRGTYSTKRQEGAPIRRYECKGCGRVFSQQSLSPERDQKRPDINDTLAKLLCEGVTMRGCGRVLNVSYDTIKARCAWLAEQARAAHDSTLKGGKLNTGWMQFDEMVTFVHARSKAVTIPMVVRGKTGEILSMKVGRIPSNGHLAAKGKSKYGWTVNESPEACRKALSEAAVAAKDVCTVTCDKATSYPKLITSAIPHAIVDASKRSKATGAYDPMFRINHTCAKIRASVAVMARKTWTTTKSLPKLQDKLDIFIAVHNGYAFC
jgi:hypothetical protein